jgi:hypothetical protein
MSTPGEQLAVARQMRDTLVRFNALAIRAADLGVEFRGTAPSGEPLFMWRHGMEHPESYEKMRAELAKEVKST